MTDEPKNEIDRLTAALAAGGIFEGYPAKRATMAGSLILGGFSAADVATVMDWAERTTTASKRMGTVALVLEDHKRLREVLDDVAMVRRAREAQTSGSPAKARDLDEVDIACRIQILVDVDHRPIPEAAEVFGITAGEAQEMLAKGRLIRQECRPALNPVPEKSGHDHGKMVERFRRGMVVSRKRGTTVSQALAEDKS